MYYIKANLPAIILVILLGFFIWRNSANKSTLKDIEYKAEKEAILKHLNELKLELKEIRLKSSADSIQRIEVIKKLPHYEENLSITRLRFIRDSLRKIPRHPLPNG